MATPILFLYAFGLIFLILGIEETENLKKIVYLGLSLFISTMAYYISYTDADYLYTAYLPLVLSIHALVMVFKTAWDMIPQAKSWEKQAEQ